jgi:thioredoxin reductase
VPIFLNYQARRAIGRFHLKGIELEPVGGGERVKTHCDLIAAGAPLSPAFELASQAGAEVAFDLERGGYVPTHDTYGRTSADQVFVAGEITGQMPVSEARKKGRIAGYAAALDIHPSQKVQAMLNRIMEAD